jgi:hypothetical protein
VFLDVFGFSILIIFLPARTIVAMSGRPEYVTTVREVVKARIFSSPSWSIAVLATRAKQ